MALASKSPRLSQLRALRQPQSRPLTTTRILQNIPLTTRRLFNLPIPPTPPSQTHHGLPSFLTHASRTSLSPSSSTYIGTHYEYTVARTLRASALTTHRIGGRADAGLDLVGTWHVPGLQPALRVIVQCKALRAKAGPNLIRELEGAFRQAPPVGWRGESVLGMLVCPREATRGVREAMARSAFPLFWVMVERDGGVRQALWNGRAEELGLGLLGVEPVYGEDEGKRVRLTWDGEELPHMDAVEESLDAVQREWLGQWGDLDEAARVQLLDVVEELYPDAKPQVTGREVNALSQEDRARVLEVLHRRIQRPGENNHGQP